MYKYRITNTSADRGAAHARPIFLTEAGRLLQPGDVAPINRLDKGTSELVDCHDLKIEEGSFPPYTPPKKAKVVVKDDDDDDAPRPKAKQSTEKASLVTVDKRKSSKIVPLRAVGDDDEAADEAEVLSSSTDDDDDLGIPAVTKADVAKGKLEDLVDPTPAPSAAVAGFRDNLRVGKKN